MATPCGRMGEKAAYLAQNRALSVDDAERILPGLMAKSAIARLKKDQKKSVFSFFKVFPTTQLAGGARRGL